MTKLIEGLILMAMGMGVVLCFLAVMIFGMDIMSKIIAYLNKLFPEAVEEVKTVSKKVSANVDEAIAVALAAIIAKKS